MKIFLFFVLIALSFSSVAQDFLSPMTRGDLSLIQKYVNNKTADAYSLKDLERNFPIHQIGSETYLACLAKVNSAYQEQQLEKYDMLQGSRVGNIISLRVPLQELSAINKLKGITYLELAQKISHSINGAVKDVHADSVHQGIGLPEAYTGKDVLIGITDWGFDYTHPNFYDTSLVETRIAAAWDQYKQSGPAPVGYTYGTEYSNMADLLAAQSDTSNIYSYALHGTHVGGIAGGSGGGSPYRGLAFEANYLFATFLIDAAAVLDAYAWMYAKAQVADKRLVINQSWGLHHIGNLDGTSLLSEMIDAYSQLGVVFVTSGGNNGSRKFHLQHDFTGDTLRSKVNFYDYSFPTMWGQSLTLWGEPSSSFSTSIQVYSSSNELLTETPFYSTLGVNPYLDSMLITGVDTIFFNVAREAANGLNNRPHVRFRVKNTNTSLKVVMQVTAANASVHCWNVVELTNDVGNWGMAFIKSRADQVDGDNNYGIGEPACSKSTIAVAAYTTNAGIATFSSYGPTMDDRIKPDISAPGVDIMSSISSFTDGDFVQGASVDFNGKTYPFARLSGTSMSGPVVTGIVALLLQANPYLSAYQVKVILQETARVDAFTGAIPNEGSLCWGAGKVNAYAAIELALQTIGDVSVKENIKEKLFVYPNPSDNDVHFSSDFNLDQMNVQLRDAQGRLINKRIEQDVLDISDLEVGMYVVHLVYEGKVYQSKLIKK